MIGRVAGFTLRRPRCPSSEGSTSKASPIHWTEIGSEIVESSGKISRSYLLPRDPPHHLTLLSHPVSTGSGSRLLKGPDVVCWTLCNFRRNKYATKAGLFLRAYRHGREASKTDLPYLD